MRSLHTFLKALLSLLFLSIPLSVLAVDEYPPIICNGLFGCGASPENLLLKNAIPTAGLVLIQIAAGGAVIAIVIAGVQMVLAYGDEGKISSARKAIFYALGGLGIALSAASIVSFVSTEDYGVGGGVIGVMATAIRIIMVLFNVAFAIVIILAGIRMVSSLGNEEEFKKGGQMIKWAVIGAVLVTIAKAGIQAFLALNF